MEEHESACKLLKISMEGLEDDLKREKEGNSRIAMVRESGKRAWS